MNESRQLYLVRRAFWTGRVRRQDLKRVFGLSDNQASVDMKLVLTGKYHVVLQRDGKTGHAGVIPVYGANIPEEASAMRMFELFEMHAPESITGLSSEELKRVICDVPIYRANNELLETIMKSCIHKTPLEILYVGLKRNEVSCWRDVLPNGIEFTGRQWRLVAQDLTTDDFIQKTFVLPRILKVRHSFFKVKKVKVKDIISTGDLYKVIINENATKDQLTAIKNELNIKEGSIALNERHVYEFKKSYCDDRSGLDKIVWPIVKEITKV